MPYVPVATQEAEPLASRSVESAALEFRTLKISITDRFEAAAATAATTQAEIDAEEVARAAADSALDARVDSLEAALDTISTSGGLPGAVYIQRFSGTGSTTVFTLGISPTAQTLVNAYVGGVHQNHDTFTVVGSTLTFSEAPTAGTQNIEVQIQYLIELGVGDVTAGSVTTFTGKTVSLTTNTLLGTTAEFNAALTDGDFATLAGAENLTNKTLTNPVVLDYTETLATPAAGSSYAVSTTLGTVTKLSTIANTTINLVSVTAGVSKSYAVIVAYGGAHTLTWTGGGTLKWAGGAAPTPTSVSGKFDIFVFTSDGVNTYGRSGGSNF